MMKILGVILIPFIYIFEVWSNYPNIWARDVYLHGQIWELDIHGNLFSIHYLYPKEYPGFFLTFYEIYKVLGISDIRIVNLFVLYPALMVVLILFIYIISYKLLKDPKLSLIASVIAFNLLQFNRNELTFVHANTRFYSIVILLITFYALLSLKDHSRRVFVIFIMATACLAISHVLFSLVPPVVLMTMLALNAIQTRRSTRHLNHIIFYLFIALTLVTTWNFYNDYNYSVRFGITSLFNYIYHLLGWKLTTASLTIREPIPFIGVVLRNYYKIEIATVTVVAYTYIVKRLLNGKLNYEEVVTASFSFSIAVVFISTLFSVSLGNSIDRMLISFPIPTSIMFLNAISTMLLRKRKNAVKVLIPLILSAMTIAGYLLVHEESVLQAYTRPLDNASIFINTYTMSQPVYLSVTSPFNIYYVYFNPASQLETVRVDSINSLNEVTEILLESKGVKVIDIRSILIWTRRCNDLQYSSSEWDNFVLSNINQYYDLIYSNGGYEYVYY
jgi:hypothetical protein